VRVEGVGGLSLQTLVQDGSWASLKAAPNYVTRHCISSSGIARLSQALLAIRQLNWPATTCMRRLCISLFSRYADKLGQAWT